MSKSWICAKCGSSMISKCPEQRSIFPSFKEGLISSLLSVQRVDDLRGKTTELFINYTGNKSATTEQIVKDLIGLISDPPEYLDNLGCEHIWVLNSETETECSLGCTHYNLKDIERLKAEAEADEPDMSERTCSELLQEYSHIVMSVIEQARRAVNITKPTFDHAIENDFHHMKRIVRLGMAKLAGKDGLQEPYRVLKSGKTYRDTKTNYFDTLEEAQQFAAGIRLFESCRVVIKKLDDKHECYEAIEVPPMEPVCSICNQAGGGLFILLPDGSAVHEKCHKELLDRPKSRLRKAKVELKKSHQWYIKDEIVETYSLKDCQHRCKRNEEFGHFVISAVCTADELDNLVESITYYLS